MENLKTGELRYKALIRTNRYLVTICIVVWAIVRISLIFMSLSGRFSWIFDLLAIGYLIFNIINIRVRVENLYLEDLDLEAYRYSIETVRPSNKIGFIVSDAFKRSRIDIAVGNFQKVIDRLEGIFLSHDGEKISPGIRLGMYRQLALSSIYLSEEEKYQRWLDCIKNVTADKRSILRVRDMCLSEVEAAHDLIIRKQPNPYFENLKTRNKLSYLSNLYYKALNAQLNQDKEAARAYFQELAQENDQLYIVRRAKEELAL